jgi:hypothetical protein
MYTDVNKHEENLMEPIEPTEQTQPNTPQEPTPTAQKQKMNKALLVVSVLLVLALAGCAVLTWMVNGQSSQNAAVNDKVKQKDQQITQLQGQLKSVKPTDTEKAADDTDTDTTPKSDTESVVAAVSAYAHAQVGLANAKITVSVNKLQAPFASASYTDPEVVAGGNGLCILKKADSTWMVLYCAQADSQYTVQLDKLFGVPASIKQ